MAALAADLGVGRTLRTPPMTHDEPNVGPNTGGLAAVRAFFGGLDVIIGVLLAALLLPLILGPFFVVYQFMQAGQYVEAAAILLLATACYAIGGRAVLRGQFGPATVFTVLGIGAAILYVAIRFRR
jgi:hypothetical protein